jgi:hypothetical protein
VGRVEANMIGRRARISLPLKYSAARAIANGFIPIVRQLSCGMIPAA